MAEVGEQNGLRVRVGHATHRGMRSTINEDFVLVQQRFGLYIVADGVGGNRSGEVASSLAAHSMCNFFESTEDGTWPDEYRVMLDLTLTQPGQRLSAAIRKANSDLYTIGGKSLKHRDMKSTVVAVHVPPGTATLLVGHVGDSRCYRVRDGRLELLTTDHSVRNEIMVEQPHVSRAQVERIPDRLIARALGTKDHVVLDIASHELKLDDRYLLCSDGVTRMLSDEQIHCILQSVDSPKQACSELIALANAAGGRDNSSTVVLRIMAA